MDAAPPGPALWLLQPLGMESQSLHPRLLLWVKSRVAVFPHPTSAWSGAPALLPCGWVPQTRLAYSWEPALQGPAHSLTNPSPRWSHGFARCPPAQRGEGPVPFGYLPSSIAAGTVAQTKEAEGVCMGLRKPEAVSIFVQC